jgi:ABC-type dipeptide/oligopeptide/nickel transport system permease component
LTRFLVARLGRVLFVVLLVSLVGFLFLRMSGNPVDAFLPLDATPQQRAAVSHELGLDQPLPVQYAIFIWDALHGNFGRSIRYGEPALQLLMSRLPATLILVVVSLGLATLLGLGIGLIAALNRGGWLDAPLMTLAFLGQVIPNFWLGLMLIVLFAVQLRWLPTSGIGSPAHLILPVLTLSAHFIAQVAFLVRSEMIDILANDYIRTARTKGLADRAIVVRHALRNALIPVVTLVGLTFGQLMGGTIILENVFAWPGVGQLAVASISARDFPVVQAAVVVLALIVVGISLLVDVFYSLLDPRIRAI